MALHPLPGICAWLRSACVGECAHLCICACCACVLLSPYQLGLSGSSAILAASLSCLLHHYRLLARIPEEQRPGLLLRAEQRLGITAGLQDRVIQTYGGLLFMVRGGQGWGEVR